MRVLLLLLLVIGAWCVPSRAEAACTGSTCQTREEAWAACSAYLPTLQAAQPNKPTRCEEAAAPSKRVNAQWQSVPPNGSWSTATFWTWVQDCPTGMTWDALTKTCKDPRCTDAPPIPTYPAKEGWVSCQSYGGYSCEAMALRQLPNQPYAGYVAWNSTGNKCVPETYQCPPGYAKAPDGTCEPIPECEPGVPRDLETNQCMQPSECPIGKAKDANGVCVPEKNLCPAGQIKGPDGSCIEDTNQCQAGTVKGDDGTCKPDSDGDGEPDPDPDGEGEHKAEDSARCDVPPKCSGDEIMCLHAKQLWRIDCNTRKARQVDMDAYCQRPPVCESVALGDEARNAACDAVEEAALIQQWRTACATSKMLELMTKGGTTGGDSGTHSRLDAIKNYLTGNGQQLDQPEVPFIEQPIESQEWSSGLSGTGTCPAPISTTITVAGFSAPVNFSFDPLCQFAGYLYAVVVTMGGLMAAFIIAGVRK